jgi:hypothetical protein
MSASKEAKMSLSDCPSNGNFETSQVAADQVGQWIEFAVTAGIRIDQFEEGLFQILLQVGRFAMQSYISQVGDGDLGPSTHLRNGELVSRLPEMRDREYVSIFGTFTIPTVAYGTREAQAIEWVPTADRLGLPGSKFSYVLQDFDQRLATECPYTQVSETIERIFGIEQHEDSLERMTRAMACEVEAFRDSQAPPLPETEGELLVLSADGKGVPICRPADSPRIDDHRSGRGPKPDRKKMATVGTVYTVDRNPRSPEEVVESLFHEPAAARPESSPRPVPQNKRVTASLSIPSDDEDKARDGESTTFGWMAEQLQDRNPDGQKETVVVMDGQVSLWESLDEFMPETRPRTLVEVLDLLHVTPRLWEMANLFKGTQTKEARELVRDWLYRILRGQVAGVIKGIRQMAVKRGMRGDKRSKVAKVCGYFDRHRHRMRYDEYLRAGYPIASGAIEGACRHYVKDRMERTGMSWTRAGAQAMLDLRATQLNGDWESYQEFRIAREQERLHPHRREALARLCAAAA